MNARIKKKRARINAQTTQIKAIQEQQAISRYIQSINPAAYTSKQLGRIKITKTKLDNAGKIEIPKFNDWDDMDSTELGAIMKKYNEYVEKGWIKSEIRELDKYESAKWFYENQMSAPQMRAAIKQADKWRASRPTPEQKFGSYDLGF